MAASTKNIPQELKEKYAGSDVETLKQNIYGKQRKHPISGHKPKKVKSNNLTKILIKLIIILLVVLIFASVFTFLEEKF